VRIEYLKVFNVSIFHFWIFGLAHRHRSGDNKGIGYPAANGRTPHFFLHFKRGSFSIVWGGSP
jgi:hypothetical protein